MTIYVDTSSQSLVISPNDIRRCLPPALTAGDTVPVVLAFLQRNPQPTNTGQPIYNYLDFSSSGVKLSVGPFGSAPTGGAFTLTFGGNTTPLLAWNISAYALQVALNALASITSAGGVAVTGNIAGPYRIVFVSNGAQALFTSATPNSLFPSSTVAVTTDQAGTSTTPATQVITLGQAATVVAAISTPQSSPAVTVTSLQGTVIQRVSIPAGTYGGTFTLTTNGNTTAAIPFAAQIDVVAAAMNALSGVAGCTVWPGQNFWDITIPSWGHAITGSATGLIVPLTLSGTLDLTPQAVTDLLDGEETVLVPFLIQTTSGTIQTYYSYLAQLNAP